MAAPSRAAFLILIKKEPEGFQLLSFYCCQYFISPGCNTVPVHQFMSIAEAVNIIYTGDHFIQVLFPGHC